MMVSSISGYGQSTIVAEYSSAYNTQEGLRSSAIRSPAKDNQGILYLLSGSHIQKFDGSTFTDLAINKVSFNINTSLYFSQENNLYVFNKDKIYKFYKFGLENKYEILALNLEKEGIFKVFNENEEEIWAFHGSGYFFVLNKNNFKLEFKQYLPSLIPYFHAQAIQYTKDSVAFLANENMVNLVKSKGKFLIKEYEQNSKNIYSNLIPIGDKNYVYITGNKLCKGDLSFQNKNELATLGNAKKPLRTSMIFWKEKKYLISYDNEVYLYDDDLGNTAKIIKSTKDHSFFRNGPIVNILVDKFHNIFLFSLAEGFAKLTLPRGIIKSIKDEDSKSNFVSRLYYDNEEEILLCGYLRTGIAIFDKDHKRLFEDKSINTPVTIWKNGNNEYLYVVMENKTIYSIKKTSSGFSKSIKLPHNETHSYYTNILFENANKLILLNGKFLENYFKSINKNVLNKTTTILEENNQSILSGVFEDKIIITGVNEIIFLDTASYKIINHLKFSDKGYIRKILRKNKSEFYLASDKGLELYTNNFEYVKTYHQGPVFSMVPTQDGRIWGGTNNGLICIIDESVMYFNMGDGLTCSEYNGNCATYTDKGNLIFGGIGGIDIFKEDALLNLRSKPECSLTSITVNDEGDIEKYYDNKNTVTLPYNKSFINIKLSPLGPGDVNSYIMQYKMEGFNENWINGLQSKNISYQLLPGSYEFKYAAGKYFDKNLKKFKSIKIKINPPVYKTWWFIILSVLASLGIISYIISLVNKIKYEREKTGWKIKENLLNLKSEFAKELHDLIGSQIGIVTRNIDYILEEASNLPEEKITDMLQQTLGLSKQITKDVRDTIWASSKETITLSEFILRLKDHTYYYKHSAMQIKIENQMANATILFHPSEALHILRIIQESIHNAEKHSKSSSLNVMFNADPQLTIDIMDYGIGFNTSLQGTGHGLENMKSRAQKIGYSFHLKSLPNNGTHIQIKKHDQI